MRIARIEYFGLEAPLDRPFGFSQGWVDRRRSVLVRVETTDGLEGWGEISTMVPVPIYVALVGELLGPRLLGAPCP